MREILFRGKCKTNGKWIFGYPVWNAEGLMIYGINKPRGASFINNFHFIDPETLCQLTGQHDDSVERTNIFEGDILQAPEIETASDVFYSDASFCVMLDNESDPLTQGLIEANHLIVIGNVYDNPELLTTNEEV